jgi:hypothetical protein
LVIIVYHVHYPSRPTPRRIHKAWIATADCWWGHVMCVFAACDLDPEFGWKKAEECQQSAGSKGDCD